MTRALDFRPAGYAGGGTMSYEIITDGPITVEELAEAIKADAACRGEVMIWRGGVFEISVQYAFGAFIDEIPAEFLPLKTRNIKAYGDNTDMNYLVKLRKH